MIGPTMGCYVEGCVADTWPDEDWLIFDSPVGSFEILLCDKHYAAFEAGEDLCRTSSWGAAVQLVMDHPVVHA